MLNKFIELSQIDISDKQYKENISDTHFFGFPIEPIIKAEENLLSSNQKSIAYFSMEYGLAPSIYQTFESKTPIAENNMLSNHEVFSNMQDMDYYHFLPLKKILDLPIYSGGLGVLAGDTLKSAADLAAPLTSIGILWHKGYFKQEFWFRGGGQAPKELSWDPNTYPGLIPLKTKIKIELSQAPLILKLWKYYVFSYDKKNVIPLILMDSNVEENEDYFKELTAQLYRSTSGWIKIAQRAILGIGGIQALKALNYSINKYHLNEGHAAFAFIEKLKDDTAENLSKLFAYTCHTPVEAGHDRFDLQELDHTLGKKNLEQIKKYGRDEKHPNLGNLTQLALNTSEIVNGVAKKHGEVMLLQFPKHKDKIKSITNGVHTHTWMSEPIKNLLLKYQSQFGDFIENPENLLQITKLKDNQDFRTDLWKAHLENKQNLAELLKYWFFDQNTFTVCWARRFATYKRPTLLFQDINHLMEIAKKNGPMQIIIAGKAHPADITASMHIDEILNKITQLNGERNLLRICFLENYDTYFGKLLTSSSDVWLNNPLPPFEASGTSGMKAILNGVVQLSTLDGWVVEAADKGIGQIFGYYPEAENIGTEQNLHLEDDSSLLYDALGNLNNLYYQTLHGKETIQKSKWIDMMINCIAQGGYFNTHRMVKAYQQEIWKV